MPSSALLLQLERGGSRPLTAQLVEQLRERVLSGELAAGESLPSSRALAAELGIARSVVVRAFEQLNGEGYLESVPGSGTRIAHGIVAAPSAAGTPAPASRIVTAASARILRVADDANRASGAVAAHTPSSHDRPIDLRTGFPFAAPQPPPEWRRALATAARLPLASQAPPPLGISELREQIAQHARRSRGMRCGPDDVIVTSGTVDALLLVALALGSRSRWFVEDPGYPEATEILRLAGAAVAPIPVTGQGMRAEQLPEGVDCERARTGSPADAVLVTPSHQFPLGGRMPAAERTALVAWAAANRALIVEDDYDSEFRHLGAALPAIAALDPGGRVVHIGSLNKSFSPSLRCGYIIATAGSPLWRALAAAKRTIGSNVPLAVQAATASFFESGGFRRYVARTRREYRHRRQVLLGALASHGLADRLFGDEGGLHAMLRLPAGLTGSRVTEILGERGVRVEGIADFARLERPDDAIAIGYGAETLARLERGVAEIARVLSSAPAEQRSKQTRTEPQ